MSEATGPAEKKARPRVAKSGAGSGADLPADPSSHGAARTAMDLAPDLFPRLGRRSTWALALLALVLGALALAFGVGRPPHPDAWRSIGEWDVTRADWWIHPLERNAFRRLVVNGDLNAVAALPDGSQVWAVGSKGLILHSPDGGSTWTQSNPKPQAPPTPLVSSFGLISVAHSQTGGGAGEARPSGLPPVRNPLAAASAGKSRASASDGSDRGTTAFGGGGAGDSGASARLRVAPKLVVKKDTDVGGSASDQTPATQTDAGRAVGGGAGPDPRNTAIDPLSADLFALHVIDARTVFAVGTSGSLLATRDGGRTWLAQSSNTTANLKGVSFASDGQRGWVVGESGTLLSTANAGGIWRKELQLNGSDLNAVSFSADGQTGVVVGKSRSSFKTVNGGQTWRDGPSGLGTRFMSVSVARDGQRIIVVGDGGVLIETRGVRTSSYDFWDLPGIFRSVFATGNAVWLVGTSGALARSINGGVNWLASPGGAGTIGGAGNTSPPVVTSINPESTTTGPNPRSVSGPTRRASAARQGDEGSSGGTGDSGGSDGGDTRDKRIRQGSAGGTAGTGGGSVSLGMEKFDIPSAYVRDTSTRASLSSVTFASDGLRGWAVGSHGTILGTSDGGNSWQLKTAGARASWRAIRLAPDGLRGLALGADGALIRTDNGGLSWSVVNANISAWLEAMHVSDDLQRIWVTGLGGIVYFSGDGGISWTAKRIPGVISINSISVSDDGQRALVVSPAHASFVMTGIDLPWTVSQPLEIGTPLAGSISRDGRIAWLFSTAGTMHRSVDSGRTWRTGGDFVGRPNALSFSVDGQRGWAVGDNGLVVHSEDGGTAWLDRRDRKSTADFIAVETDGEGRRAWVAGRDGALMNTSDGGLVWTSQKAPPGTRLNALSVAKDWKRAMAVGENGDMISTDDGGVSWRDRVRYERYPAPLSIAAGIASLLLLALVVAFGRWRPAPAPPPEDPFRVPPTLGSDQPVIRLADDRLGHASAVLALSDFIRNPDTEPKLTIAITAPWGMGKTSMMGMLREQLDMAGFRTAWFNAWHHQQEGRQLSALFNTIRTQAVPSIFREPAGAIRVRMRLLWSRGWLYRFAWVLLALLVLDFFRGWNVSDLSAPYYLKLSVNHHWLNQPRVAVTPATLVKLNPFEAATARPCDSVPTPQPRATAVLRPELYCYLHKALVRPWDGQAQICNDPREIGAQRCVFANSGELFDLIDRSMHGPDATRRLLAHERSAIAAALEQLPAPPMLPTIMHFLPLLALLGLLMTKGFAVYGVELLRPLRQWLLPRVANDATGELPGTIEHYRTEFRLLTDALHGRLVVFIDDLDRCDAATVNGLLETSNYLIDHGRCFIVLGAAMDKVKACIESKLPGLPNDEREKYQTEYLRKLVHIELPVPPPSATALDAMMSDEKTAKVAVDGGKPGRVAAVLMVLRGSVLRCWHWLRRSSAIILLAVAVYALAQLAIWMTSHDTPTRIDPGQTTAATASPTPEPRSLVPTTGQPVGAPAAKPKIASDSFSGNVGLVTGAPYSQPNWMLTFGMAVLLALTLIASRFQPVAARLRVALGGALLTADTGQFMYALLIWKTAVRLGDATPRGIKRFTNRARLFALHERKAHQKKAIAEQHVVALTAMHHVQPEYLEWLLQQTLPEATASRADWLTKLEKPQGIEAPAPLELQAQRQIVECLHDHVRLFGFPSADDLSRFWDLLARVSVR